MQVCLVRSRFIEQRFRYASSHHSRIVRFYPICNRSGGTPEFQPRIANVPICRHNLLLHETPRRRSGKGGVRQPVLEKGRRVTLLMPASPWNCRLAGSQPPRHQQPSLSKRVIAAGKRHPWRIRSISRSAACACCNAVLENECVRRWQRRLSNVSQSRPICRTGCQKRAARTYASRIW